MARSLAAVLDECLVALGEGASLKDCLARHPKYAEELRLYLPLAQRLTQTPRHEPRTAAQAGAWDRFRARAEDMRLGRKPSLFTLNMGWMRPLAIASALVLAVLFAAGGTAYAAQDSLPDSPLYRVKLATEDVRVWVTFGDSAKAELLLDQSNERTDEIMEMLQRGKPIGSNVLTALRERNARAVRILEDKPEELRLKDRAHNQSAEQEDLLLVLWGDTAESARDEYAEAVATLHNAQLRTSEVPGSVRPEDLAAGVINIAGTAEPVTEGVWLLGGVEVRIDIRSRGDTQLESGQAVSVIAARDAEGRLLALDVTATDSQKPEQQYVVSAAVEDISDDEVVIAGQRIAITERTLLKLRLQLGQRVEIRVKVDASGQAVASSIEGPAGGSQEEAPPLLAYEGIIEGEVSTEEVTNDWVVGGQRFTVTPSTEIDARGGTLVEGARARVEAVSEVGEVVAKRVVIISDDPGGDVIRVEGVLEEGDEENWTISGIEVDVPIDIETPEIGSLITLEGRRQDKRLVAESVSTTYDPEGKGLALLRGSIRSIEEGKGWRVGFATVEIPDETVVIGEPQVGSEVFVWGSLDDRGALEAVYVSVINGTPQPPPEE